MVTVLKLVTSGVMTHDVESHATRKFVDCYSQIVPNLPSYHVFFLRKISCHVFQKENKL